jgi:hypothetical protein
MKDNEWHLQENHNCWWSAGLLLPSLPTTITGPNSQLLEWGVPTTWTLRDLLSWNQSYYQPESRQNESPPSIQASHQSLGRWLLYLMYWYSDISRFDGCQEGGKGGSSFWALWCCWSTTNSIDTWWSLPYRYDTQCGKWRRDLGKPWCSRIMIKIPKTPKAERYRSSWRQLYSSGMSKYQVSGLSFNIYTMKRMLYQNLLFTSE